MEIEIVKRAIAFVGPDVQPSPSIMRLSREEAVSRLAGDGPRDLSGADLQGMDLRGVDLRGANLDGASLRAADLTGADLSNASLREACLWGARMVNATG